MMHAPKPTTRAMQSDVPRKWPTETWKTTHLKVGGELQVNTISFDAPNRKSALHFFNILVSVLEEVTLAMEEILEKEKDLKQIVEVTQILFERTNDLTSKNDTQANQLSMAMSEQAKLHDSLSLNEELSNSQKERLS